MSCQLIPRADFASTFEQIDLFNDLKQGQHVLTCKLERHQEGGTVFRISATVSR